MGGQLNSNLYGLTNDITLKVKEYEFKIYSKLDLYYFNVYVPHPNVH